MNPVVTRLAEATRQELAVQQEARARQGQAVLSARVVAVVPLVVLLGLSDAAPDFMPVNDPPLGQLVLVGCFDWVAVDTRQCIDGAACRKNVGRSFDEPIPRRHADRRARARRKSGASALTYDGINAAQLGRGFRPSLARESHGRVQ